MGTISDFKEVLELLPNERPDVRKQVLQVMHTFLQNDDVLDYYMEHCSEETKMVAEMVQPGEQARGYLSSTLILLINLSDKGACSRAMLEARVIQRVMLLLEKGGLASELQELCLILINNLTSVSVHAVQALLQLENKTLEGFYLSQLIRRFVDEHVDASELMLRPSEDDGLTGGGRDRTKWIGSILGNCAQCEPGRKLLIDDEENIERYTKLVSSKDAQLRLSVCSLLKNLFHDADTHGILIENKAAAGILSRIVNKEERNPDILDVLCNAILCMSLSEAGVAYLDGSGAKKNLLEVLPSINENSRAYADIKKVCDALDDIQDVMVIDEDEEKEKRRLVQEAKTAADKKAKKEELHSQLKTPIPTQSGVEVLDDDEELEVPLAPIDDETTLAEKDMADVE